MRGTLGGTLGVLKGYEHRGVATRGGPSVGVGAGVADGVLLAATIRNVANPKNAWALNLRASSCECACSYDLNSSAGFTPNEHRGTHGEWPTDQVLCCWEREREDVVLTPHRSNFSRMLRRRGLRQ